MAYYLSKSERPYSDFEGELQLEGKNGAKYYQCYRNERSAANFADTCDQVLKNAMVEDVLIKTRILLSFDG